MEISIISFTENGEKLAERVADCLRGRETCILYTKRGRSRSGRKKPEYRKDARMDGMLTECADKFQADGAVAETVSDSREGAKAAYVTDSLTDWAGRQFQTHNALLFIGAAGIAVRSIAPFVKDKLADSPVLVMEETGQFVIPLLSGHYGGANALAREIAEGVGAVPVITTATDVNHLFAVDVFAAKNHLWIADRGGIAKVSAGILERRSMTMALAGDYGGMPPEEVELYPYPPERNVDVSVAVDRPEGFSAKLQLVPRSIVLGMGCKKGKTEAEIERFVLGQLKLLGIPIQAAAVLATIDRKCGEAGLIEFAEKYGLNFCYATAGELAQVPGSFFSSPFVAEQVGVDNVCERAAMFAAGADGKLLLKKTAQDGMTLAVAERRWSVRFDEA